MTSLMEIRGKTIPPPIYGLIFKTSAVLVLMALSICNLLQYFSSSAQSQKMCQWGAAVVPKTDQHHSDDNVWKWQSSIFGLHISLDILLLLSWCCGCDDCSTIGLNDAWCGTWKSVTQRKLKWKIIIPCMLLLDLPPLEIDFRGSSS